MANLPTGTVTFLLTDIEGSTALWERGPERMRAALARHDALLTAGIEGHGGTVVKSRGEGDSVFAVFSRASDAVAAAADVQRALRAEPWPTAAPLRVRMALHTGEAELRDGDYYGTAVNRCARLRAAGHGDQALLSEASAAVVRASLPEGARLRDLGEHRLRDLQEPERVFQLVLPDVPADFPALRTLDARPTNLPLRATPLIGREREVEAVETVLLREDVRLLTLTGAGGSGKTRLALEVAAELRDRFRDGVWLVELAALAEPALVPEALASALGVREGQGRPIPDALRAFLEPRALLLVLDNCEHLIHACADLVERLLSACPELRILATSREPLRIRSEATWRVPSLAAPDPERVPPEPDALARYPAVRLFEERARAAHPAFLLSPRNAAAVAEICARLDGMPLALELAAARVKVLSPEQIAARLDDRFRLLTAGSRTALPRQRTLRGAIDWSYGLLPGPERLLLRRLAVFAGGWTIEAGEGACSGDGIAADEVLDLLAQLVDKSLVLAEGQDGQMRYRLLETLRQYAEEELRGAGEEAVLRGRHGEWFLDLAERAELGLVGPEQTAWLERLEREHDNLRGALRWAVEHREAETGLRLGAGLWRFWWVHGHLSEGQRWLEAALSQAAGASPIARAKALNAAGNLAMVRGEYEPARAFHEESLALWRGLGDRGGIATALYYLARVVLAQGDYAAARAPAEESLALRRALNDRWGMAVSLNFLGEVARAQGDYAAAGPPYEEGLELFRAVGDTRGVAIATHNLGIVAREQGDHERAAALHHVALALFRELGDKEQIACSLIKLAHLALLQGDSERAARLSGAVDAQREAIGAALLPDERADHVQTVSTVRSKQGEAAFSAAWAAGRAMSPDQAIDYALGTDPAASIVRVEPSARRRPDLLTPREAEVAALVAQGRTNRQIAERLVISERTADNHVTNILNRLGLDNRAQVAVWAAEHGLLPERPGATA